MKINKNTIPKLLIPILCIALVFALCSCTYTAYKTYYNNIEDYDDIWELTGFYHGYEGKSTFFPNDISSLNVKEFFCRYDEELPLGENVQILLEIEYDEDDFAEERERLSKAGFECSDSFDIKGIEAYATNLGTSGVHAYISEYALLDSDQNTIEYIFLHGVPKEEIEFDHQFLPIGYTGYGEIER